VIKSKRLVLFGFVLWFGATQLIFAQTAKKVLVYDLDGEQLVKYRVKSVQECILIANELQSKYQEQGFLGCSVDTVYFSDSVYIIQFFQGIAYQIKSLTIDDPLKLLTNKLKIKQQQPLTLIFYNQLLSEIKQTYNNNGYALAEVNNSNTFESDQCILWFKIEPGLKYQYGEIRADEKIIQTKALKALIGINEGDVFNQRKVNRIPIVINNTGYLQLDSIKTTFSPEAKANIRLEMSSLKTNSISGLIGIAPSPDNKTSLTGELNFKLVNSLKQGEYFDLTWRKSGIGSQYLKMESNYPYINGKNVGVAAGIEMDKQDTTFISTEWNTGLVTTFARSSRLIFSYSNFKSNRIDTTNDQFGMVKSWLYGGQLIMNRTNFRLNPSSGFTLMALLRFGQHNLKKGKLEKSNISKFGFEGRLFIPIKQSAIVLGNIQD
jgi:outer membrane protein assembly factor BamA